MTHTYNKKLISIWKRDNTNLLLYINTMEELENVAVEETTTEEVATEEVASEEEAIAE